MNTNRKQALLAIVAASFLGAACTKKTTAAAAPPPPGPTRATASESTPAAPAHRQPERAAPAERAAAVTAPSRTPDAATRVRIGELLSKIEDAYFDYDKATLRDDATKTLAADATELRNILKDYPDYKLTIEGHADERGSAEYNLALGEKRAAAGKEYLVQIGIPATQLNQTSYGRERPVCHEENEACWQKNRRIHIVPADGSPTR